VYSVKLKKNGNETMSCYSMNSNCEPFFAGFRSVEIKDQLFNVESFLSLGSHFQRYVVL